MSTRIKLPKKLKAQLVSEAGGKCANPGCARWRTHIHHIQHWHVYKAHRSGHMIAICPACHDSVHSMPGIPDDTLYAWKGIERADEDVRDHIYVEPARILRVLTGSMCVELAASETAVFELSNSNRFSFRALDEDIFLAKCEIKDLTGEVILKIVENYVTVKKSDLVTVHRPWPGKIVVKAPSAGPFLPEWVSRVMPRVLPDIATNGLITLIDIEVVRPGVIRLCGVFIAHDAIFVALSSKILLLRPEIGGPIAIVGSGENCIIKPDGAVTSTAFRL